MADTTDPLSPNTGLINNAAQANPQPPVTPGQATAPNPIQGTTVAGVTPMAAADLGATPQAQTGFAVTPADDAAAGQAGASTVAFDPKTQTVQGQLAGILASGNPLLVQAQTRARQAANASGLLNSSMAVGAGESALYDAATPIATSDAGAYNQASQLNAQLGTQASIANANNTTSVNQFNTGQQNQISTFNSGQQQQTNLANAQTALDAAKAQASLTQQASQTNVQNAQQTAIQNAANQQQASVVSGTLDAQTATANAQLATSAAITNAQLGNQTALANIDEANKVLLQQMSAETQTNLMNIQANYQTLIQSDASASTLYSQVLKDVSDITNNKDLDATAKNTAIAAQQAYLQNGLNLIGSFNNLQIPDLVGNLGGGSTPPVQTGPTMTTLPINNGAPGGNN